MAASKIDIEKEIRLMLSKIIHVPPGDINLDSKFVEDLGMDSILGLEIFAAIEKKFKVTIPDEEIQKVTSLRQTIELAKKYIAKERK